MRVTAQENCPATGAEAGLGNCVKPQLLVMTGQAKLAVDPCDEQQVVVDRGGRGAIVNIMTRSALQPPIEQQILVDRMAQSRGSGGGRKQFAVQIGQRVVIDEGDGMVVVELIGADGDLAPRKMTPAFPP